MPPIPNQRLNLPFIHTALLPILFSLTGFLCQNNPQYANCNHPFQCGTLTNISWPFWGENRPPSCRYPGFQLDCRSNHVPLLNISSVTYRVLEINFSTRTLRVARQDLWNTTCPTTSLVHSTTLTSNIFKFPLNSEYESITLYYGCTNYSNGLLNQFTCEVNGVTTLNLFRAGNDSSSGPGTGITCNDSVSVLVNQQMGRALERSTANSSMSVLQDALANGVFIRWSDDIVLGVAPVQSHGSRRFLSSEISIDPIVIQILAGLLVIACLIGCFRKRHSIGCCYNKENNLDIEKFLLQHGSPTLKRYKYSEIKKMTKSLSEKLGQGGYGSVYKGKLPDGSLVAVKVLTDTDSNGEDFINEVASISRTSHVNIVNLLGFCFESKNRALVYEYMPNKSLDKYIGNSTGSDKLDLKRLYKIAVGVAKGLEYLHTGCNTRIVHFDIKPQNILLDEELCPKISDFGLAKLCKKKQSLLSLMGTRGTVGYIAPEVFSRNFGRVSNKSDVYSYGMMVLEMAGENTILDRTETTQLSENCFPDKIYERALDKTNKLYSFRIEEEEEAGRKMLLVGFWCIQTNPSDRPSISKVVEMLEGSLQYIQLPPKPVLFSPTQPVLQFTSSFSSYVETEPSAEGITQE